MNPPGDPRTDVAKRSASGASFGPVAIGRYSAGSRFRCLDAVRGAAILWIVCFHLLNDRTAGMIPFFTALVKLGRLGVPVFFLVSGFALSAAAQRVLMGEKSPWDFFKDRLKRIYGPLFFSLVFAGFILPLAMQAAVLVLEGRSDSFFYSYGVLDWLSLITLARVFYPAEGGLNRAFLPINGVLWFVAVLVQMYAVIFLALLNRSRYFLSLCIVTAAWACAFFLPEGSLPRGFFLPCWGFFFLGLLQFYSPGYPLLCSAGAVAIGTFVSLKMRLDEGLFLMGVFFVLMGLRSKDDVISANPILRAGSWVGGFAYSLYLLHVPLDDWVTTVMFSWSPLPALATDCLLIIPSIVLICFAWSQVFEKPFMRSNLRVQPHPRRNER